MAEKGQRKNGEQNPSDRRAIERRKEKGYRTQMEDGSAMGVVEVETRGKSVDELIDRL